MSTAKKSKTKSVKVVKLHISAGKAAPTPPVGTILGPTGIKMMDFCKAFNKLTEKMKGKIPVKIIINPDRTFTFSIKKPTITCLIKNELNLTSGAKHPGKEVCATINKFQIVSIAKEKMEDLNIYPGDIDNAIKIITGSAKSMGILIEEDSSNIKEN